MLLDTGFGILLSIFAAEVLKIPFSPFLLAISILFCLLPDLDFIIEVLMFGKVGGKKLRIHRLISHYPLFYLPILIILAVIAWKYAVLLLIGLTLHFVHDLIGIGWGLKLFWPFSQRNYKLFANKNGKTTMNQFLVSWSPSELKKKMKKHGNENWFKDIFLRPTLISIIELIGFIISIIILYFYLK